MQATLYLRVSTLHQAAHGISLGTADDPGFQEARCRELCQRRGWTIGGVYRDAGSGRKRAGRPQFELAMREVCAAGGVLVVYSLSRASRSQRDIHNMTHELAKANANIASATEDFDTTTAFGKAFFGLVAVFAQLESDQIGERVKASNDFTIAKVGHRTQGRAPYGWRFDKRKRMRVEDVTEQAVLRIIDDARSRGVGWESIARSLNQHPVPARDGDWWSRATVFRVYHRWLRLKGVTA